MKKFTVLLVFTFTILCLNAAVFGQVSITGTTPVTQNFDGLTAATFNLTDNTSITGVYAFRASANAVPNVFTADTGGNATGRFNNYGSSAATDRALGSIGSGSTGTLNYGVRFKNNTGSTITALTVSYTGEQWRNGGNATSQPLSFDYRQAATVTDLTSGTYTAVTALNFNTPTNSLTAAALDGNAAANRATLSQTITVSIPAGEEIMLRWTDLNDAGNDHGVSIDDLSVTATLAPTANVDLTITHDTSDVFVEQGQSVTYNLTVANSGMDAASNVKVNFPIPPNLINAPTANGTVLQCGFTLSTVGNLVTFTNGTVPAGGSCNLQVITTAQTAGVLATSLGSNTVVDPDNTITETNETNNTATTDLEVRVLFPATVVGLFGRGSLANLLTDISDIGGGRRVILDQNLTETSNIVVPDGVTIDFRNFTVTGNITFSFGSGDGAGFRTANINGLGNSGNPGSLQVNEVIFDGLIDTEYYAELPPLTKLGGLPQTAYNHPTEVGDFRINNPDGVNILAPFTVSGDLYLTDGIIFNGANSITLAEFSRLNGENGSGGSETSFAAGSVTKLFPSFFGDAGFATDFIFPVGTVGGPDAGYSPLRAANFSTAAPDSSLTVTAFDVNAPGIRTPSLSRYWQIDEVGAVTTDLQFFWRIGDDTAITNQAVATIVRNGVVACDMNCSLNFTTRNASITGVSEFSPWTIAQTSPTAAGASINGRVLNSRGFAVVRAKVIVTDQSGNTVTTTTNDFGNYSVEGLRAGETYIVNVIAKQAQYNSRIVTLNEDATNLDFTPQE